MPEGLTWSAHTAVSVAINVHGRARGGGLVQVAWEDLAGDRPATVSAARTGCMHGDVGSDPLAVMHGHRMCRPRRILEDLIR